MNMRITGLVLLVMLLAMVAVACSDRESEQAAAPAEPVTQAPEVEAPELAETEAAPATPANPPAMAESELHDTAWTLVKIQSMDDSVVEPAANTAYTISFNADGSANMQVDCNRGAGSWQSPSAGQLTFGPLALTRAMCPPGSIHDQFVRELEYVRTYTMRDGNLYLATMADGSILEFKPLAD